MDVAHVVLLVLHIGGVLALLAGLLLQVRHPEKKVVGLMRDGIGTAFLAGLFLVAVLEAGDDPVDRTKIAVKFAVGLVVLVLVMANLRKPRIPDGLYWSLLVLTLADVGVALLWG
jgi:hypothetical protein